MRTGRLLTAILFSMILGAFSLPAWAADVTVDCDNGESLNDALSTLDPMGPHNVTVTGTCTENVIIRNLERVTIHGAPSASIVNAATPARDVVKILSSRGILLYGLTLSGGDRGVFISRSDAQVAATTIENNVRTGVQIQDQSLVSFGGPAPEYAVTIRGNGVGGINTDFSQVSLGGYVTVENSGIGSGLRLWGSQATVLGGNPGENVFRGNGNYGVLLLEGSSARFLDSNRIEDNSAGGVLVFNSSGYFTAGPSSFTSIENNAGVGMVVFAAAQAWLQGPIRIRYNGSSSQAAGILLGQNATLVASGATVSQNAGAGILADASSTMELSFINVSGNGGDGVKLLHLSVADVIAPSTVSGNGGAGLFCDNTSLAYGDLSGITPIQCGGATKGGGKKGGAAFVKE